MLRALVFICNTFEGIRFYSMTGLINPTVRHKSMDNREKVTVYPDKMQDCGDLLESHKDIIEETNQVALHPHPIPPPLWSAVDRKYVNQRSLYLENRVQSEDSFNTDRTLFLVMFHPVNLCDFKISK